MKESWQDFVKQFDTDNTSEAQEVVKQQMLRETEFISMLKFCRIYAQTLKHFNKSREIFLIAAGIAICKRYGQINGQVISQLLENEIVECWDTA